MASIREIYLLADEGISMEVNMETLEITEVSIDGKGSIEWLHVDDEFTRYQIPLLTAKDII